MVPRGKICFELNYKFVIQLGLRNTQVFLVRLVLEAGKNEKCPLNWEGILRWKNEADSSI